MFRSAKMRANTGNAVTDIAAPRNSAKLVNGTSSDDSRGYSSKASNEPNRKGATMLACEIATVAWARWRSNSEFNSSPTRNMYKITPNCAIKLRCGATDCGNNHAEASGDSQPSSDGPNTIPPITSPITDG